MQRVNGWLPLVALVMGCAGASEDRECLPNETASSGDSFRRCSSAGEWGPWVQMSSNDQANSPTNNEPPGEAVPCLSRSATYVFSYTLTGCGGLCVCGELAPEIVRITAGGQVLAPDPPAHCEATPATTEGCHVTGGTECRDSYDGLSRTESLFFDVEWFANGSGGEGILTKQVTLDGVATACTYTVDVALQ